MQFGLGLLLIIRLQFGCCCCLYLFIYLFLNFSGPILRVCVCVCKWVYVSWTLRHHYNRATVWSNWYGSVGLIPQSQYTTKYAFVYIVKCGVLCTFVEYFLYYNLSFSLFFLFRPYSFCFSFTHKASTLNQTAVQIPFIYFMVATIRDGFQLTTECYSRRDKNEQIIRRRNVTHISWFSRWSLRFESYTYRICFVISILISMFTSRAP